MWRMSLLVWVASLFVCCLSCVERPTRPGVTGCVYSGGRLKPGEKGKIKNCSQCECTMDSVYRCCNLGRYYIRYPDTCKIVKDANGCERLVYKKNPSAECKDGPVSAIAR